MSLAIDPLEFDAGIKVPLAQVTVIDADEGDCNVVDFCQLPLVESGKDLEIDPDSWRRCIIDTGPSGTKPGAVKQVGINITNTLVEIATRLRLPTLSSESNYGKIPSIGELQVTHPDDDHIGNAVAFLKHMCTSANISGIRGAYVVFCLIPELFAKPEITQEVAAGVSLAANDYANKCTYVASIPQKWEKEMNQAGFAVQVELRPRTKSRKWTFDTNKAEWDDDTINQSYNDRCTLYWYEEASINLLRFELVAQISIYMQDQGDLVAVVKQIKLKTKIKFESKVTRNKTFLSSINQQVPLSSAQKENYLQTKTTFTVPTWIPNAKKQKKSVKSFNLSKVMANMIIAEQPKTPIKTVLRMPQSVPQVVDLGNEIETLNSVQNLNPNLTPYVPVYEPPRGHKGWVANNDDAQELYIGPSASLYHNMMRQIMLNRYALEEKGQLPAGHNELDGDDINRSSVVTVFARKDVSTLFGKTYDARFNMLFTGDAFDRQCDIRDTLLSWDPVLAPPTLQVNVLKVPHHGSDRTATAGFYSYCRAYVYIISGCHQNEHGNPKYSTLEAIVKGFKDQTTPDGSPFLIFFSNSRADLDHNAPSKPNDPPSQSFRRSAVLAILANPALRPGASGYNYRMFKVNPIKPYPVSSKIPVPAADQYANFGGLLFGKDGQSRFVTTWDAARWVEMK